MHLNVSWLAFLAVISDCLDCFTSCPGMDKITSKLQKEDTKFKMLFYTYSFLVATLQKINISAEWYTLHGAQPQLMSLNSLLSEFQFLQKNTNHRLGEFVRPDLLFLFLMLPAYLFPIWEEWPVCSYRQKRLHSGYGYPWGPFDGMCRNFYEPFCFLSWFQVNNFAVFCSNFRKH